MRTPLLLIIFCAAIASKAQVDIPYTTGFEGQVGNLAPLFPEGWTWEDLNTVPFGDQGWQIIKNTGSQQNAHTDSTAAHMFSHSSEQNNDWLYTPGMQLQGGVTYTFSFWYSVAPLFPSTERLAVKKGSNPTALAMGEPLWINTSITNQTYEQGTFDYTPVNDEVTYFAFHYFSEEFQFILLLDDVSITGSTASVAELNSDVMHLWLQSGILNVDLPRSHGTSVLSILDAAGRNVRTAPLAGCLTSVGIGELPEGSYLARVATSNGKTFTKRFVILR